MDPAPVAKVAPTPTEDGGDQGPVDTDLSSEMQFYWRASIQRLRKPMTIHFRVESPPSVESRVGLAPSTVNKAGPSSTTGVVASPEYSTRGSLDGSRCPNTPSTGGHQ